MHKIFKTTTLKKKLFKNKAKEVKILLMEFQKKTKDNNKTKYKIILKKMRHHLKITLKNIINK